MTVRNLRELRRLESLDAPPLIDLCVRCPLCGGTVEFIANRQVCSGCRHAWDLRGNPLFNRPSYFEMRYGQESSLSDTIAEPPWMD